ncbi:MAG: monovalent cation/H(+) antiporter subunit G [Pseudomonadota bacterium]|jgi:multicomponent K+:H+ antiporter subunit G
MTFGGLLLEALLAVLVLAGGLFVLVSGIGVIRLRDVYQRMHAPTKAATLGVGCLLAAAALSGLAYGRGVSANEWLVALFLFLTAPVSAYLVARVALHHGVGDREGLASPEPPGEESGERPA